MTTQSNADFAALALRVASGGLFIAHGVLKLTVFTVAGTVAYFESLGLPGVFAYLTILAEVVGGAMLVLGVGVRLVSLAVIPVLLGAVWAHAGNGWLFSSEGGGWEYPLFWAVAQLAILILGAGALAVRVPALQRTLGQFA